MNNDELLNVFLKCDKDKRYEFIAKTKNYLKSHKELKSDESHQLYIEIILHHLEFLKKEYAIVLNLSKQYSDQDIDYDLGYLPNDLFNNRTWFLTKLAEWRLTLENEISIYKQELKNRLI